MSFKSAELVQQQAVWSPLHTDVIRWTYISHNQDAALSSADTSKMSLHSKMTLMTRISLSHYHNWINCHDSVRRRAIDPFSPFRGGDAIGPSRVVAVAGNGKSVGSSRTDHEPHITSALPKETVLSSATWDSDNCERVAAFLPYLTVRCDFQVAVNRPTIT